MSRIADLYEKISAVSCVSGREYPYYYREVPEPFRALGAKLDAAGNMILEKKSGRPDAKTVLLEAHFDHVGFCVSDVTENGFLIAAPCGGVDADLIPGTELIIEGREPVLGIGASVPPHLLGKADSENQEKKTYIDCGFSSRSRALELVSIGDPITFAPGKILQNGMLFAPGLDNKASVIALLLAYDRIVSDFNLIFAFTVGEETTSRGVKSLEFEKKADLALVVDVGFGYFQGLQSTRCLKMRQGPSVSISDTLSRKASFWIKEVAEKKKIPLQVICEPGGTGTSATALQLQQGGIPSAVISIPLSHMHTPSEGVFLSDIDLTVQLLCALLEEKSLPFSEVEDEKNL